MTTQQEDAQAQILLKAYREGTAMFTAPAVEFAPASTTTTPTQATPRPIVIPGDGQLTKKTRELIALTPMGRAVLAQWDEQHAPAKTK